MKHIDRFISWSGLVAAIGLTWAMAVASAQGGDAKPFKETGTEHFVTQVEPGSFQHQHFVNARARYGTEVWTGVILHVSQNNVGGAGSGLAMETVHIDPTAPKGVIVYAMKYEVVANGDQLAMAGTLIPQADGSIVGELVFLPDESTGRFAGATGKISKVWAPVPMAYAFEGWITTVGAVKKLE